MSRDPTNGGENRLSTDRETIRGWADEHRAIPIRRADSGPTDESSEYRVVRESTVGESHERADWDEFFNHLDEGERVVVYRGAEADEPFDVTHREEALTRSGLSETELEERLIEGETVTSEVRETTVVESIVVEEATVESELVDTELVDQEVLDVELAERECTGCRLVETSDRGAGHRDWFDEDRYLGSIDTQAPAGRMGDSDRVAGRARTESRSAGSGTGTDADRGSGTMDADRERGTMDADRMGTMDSDRESADAESETAVTGERQTGTVEDERRLSEVEHGTIDASNVPYSTALDVEEVWSVTRGFVERFTVESRVADTEVAETDAVEDRDIDVEGLHRSIATSDLLDVDLSSDEVLNECEIQTEFAEDDRIRTQFDRDCVVEDEVIDRKQLQADVTGGDVLAMEVVSTLDVATEITDEGGTPAEAGASTEMDAGRSGPASTDTTGSESDGVEPDARPGRVTLTDDEIGKTVVDATGEEIGMVAAVEENGEVMRVDTHPGITDRIKAALDWGDSGNDDYPVEIEQIERVTDEQVELKGTDELGGIDRAD